MQYKVSDTNPELLASRVSAAQGRTPSDLVIRNAQILDVFGGSFYSGDLAVLDHVIVGAGETYSGREEIDGTGLFAVPGFIDAHVHIESSLMSPARFQESVLPRGTTTAFWDPHEVANVHGDLGVRWALDSCQNLLMDVFVLVPSCVPATHMETSGASLSSADLAMYRNEKGVMGLAEFMNVPGVLFGDVEVANKLSAYAGTIRDGHSPMLRGRDLSAYLCAGIQGCHECTGIDEAREKMRKGLHVLIREGSCAKDAQTLLPLVDAYSSSVLAFCSDDRNPLDVAAEGHIDHIVKLGLEKGLDAENLFRVASFGAARAYGFLDRGVLAPGYLADVVLLRQRKPGSWHAGFEVVHVIKKGKKVLFEELKSFANSLGESARPKTNRRNINTLALSSDKFKVTVSANQAGKTVSCRVIGVLPKKIVTENLVCDMKADENGVVSPDISRDILKIVVVERHHKTGNVGKGFVQGFALKQGAIALSIGHDSHNITAVGCDDASLIAAVDAVKKCDGGIVVVDGQRRLLASLELPIAGLMTDASSADVAESLRALKTAARQIGCVIEEPFLQLSFLSLPVIPALKLTDKGLVDVNKFDFVSLVMEGEQV
jgi:adenine deaminase